MNALLAIGLLKKILKRGKSFPSYLDKSFQQFIIIWLQECRWKKQTMEVVWQSLKQSLNTTHKNIASPHTRGKLPNVIENKELSDYKSFWNSFLPHGSHQEKQVLEFVVSLEALAKHTYVIHTFRKPRKNEGLRMVTKGDESLRDLEALPLSSYTR